MYRARSIVQSAATGLALSSFISGNAVEASDGSWSDPTTVAGQVEAAINQWLDAAEALGVKAVGSAGNYLIRNGDLIKRLNKVRIEGEGRFDTNFIYQDPRPLFDGDAKPAAILFGSRTAGECWVQPDDSTLTLAADATTSSVILTLANSIIGEAPTARLRAGMKILIVDHTQGFPYRSFTFDINDPHSLCLYYSSPSEIALVLNDTQIQLKGIPKYNLASGAKVGYFNAPVDDLVLENLRFTYDLVNSHYGDVVPCLELNGCINAKLYGLRVVSPTTRAFSFKKIRDLDLDDVQFMNGQEFGSGMTISSMCANGWLRRLRSDGDVNHLVDFGGGAADGGAVDFTIVAPESIGSAALVSSHKSASGITTLGGKAIMPNKVWNADDDIITDEDVRGAGVAHRGFDNKTVGVEVIRFPTAFRIHSAEGNELIDCTSINCGRGELWENGDRPYSRGNKHHNPVFLGVDMIATTGPSQNLSLLSEVDIGDITISGRAVSEDSPSFADFRIQLGGQYSPSALKGLGWRIGPFHTGGRVPICIGLGNASALFTTGEHIPQSSSDMTRQYTGPASSIAIVTGAYAVSSVANSGADYVPNERITLAGGTFTVRPVYEVKNVKLSGFTIQSPGSGFSAGQTYNLVNNDVVTVIPTVHIDAVDGSGGVTAASIANAGVISSIPSDGTYLSGAGGAGTGLVIENLEFNIVDGRIVEGGAGTVMPSNPVSQLSTSARGSGATFNLTFGKIADISKAIKRRANITGTGPIDSLGFGRNLEYDVTLAADTTLNHSSVLVMPDAVTRLVKAGQPFKVQADNDANHTVARAPIDIGRLIPLVSAIPTTAPDSSSIRPVGINGRLHYQDSNGRVFGHLTPNAQQFLVYAQNNSTTIGGGGTAVSSPAATQTAVAVAATDTNTRQTRLLSTTAAANNQDTGFWSDGVLFMEGDFRVLVRGGVETLAASQQFIMGLKAAGAMGTTTPTILTDIFGITKGTGQTTYRITNNDGSANANTADLGITMAAGDTLELMLEYIFASTTMIWQLEHVTSGGTRTMKNGAISTQLPRTGTGYSIGHWGNTRATGAVMSLSWQRFARW